MIDPNEDRLQDQVVTDADNDAEDDGHPLRCVHAEFAGDGELLENLRLIYCQLNGIHRMHLDNIVKLESLLITLTSKDSCENKTADEWKKALGKLIQDINKQNHYAKFPEDLQPPRASPPDTTSDPTTYSRVRGFIKKIIKKFRG